MRAMFRPGRWCALSSTALFRTVWSVWRRATIGGIMASATLTGCLTEQGYTGFYNAIRGLCLQIYMARYS
jgi:hypothetical protein